MRMTCSKGVSNSPQSWGGVHTASHDPSRYTGLRWKCLLSSRNTTKNAHQPVITQCKKYILQFLMFQNYIIVSTGLAIYPLFATSEADFMKRLTPDIQHFPTNEGKLCLQSTLVRKCWLQGSSMYLKTDNFFWTNQDVLSNFEAEIQILMANESFQ